MHATATTPSPFQHKFNCRLGRRISRAQQPQVAPQAIAGRSPAQNLAAALLALAISAVLLAGLPTEVRAQTQNLQPSASSTLVRVISSTPNLERITETRQQCGYETQQVLTPPAPNQAGMGGTGGALLGALAGGLLASQVGKGNGRHVAIAAGSATGALVGKNLAEQSSPTAGYATYKHQQVQVCRPVSVEREQVRDYTVRYEHQGQEYQVQLPQQPGQWLKLNISHTIQAV
ncbi:glycine zipper 2TM domain-containing protein [Roseateles oligotrophus]|uniref:Glycine zipper 2TM domain-containing protein n=1 Tax=Roseateles oligotrophus TaxID=1769250 RepID=A0ABT2YLA1_9BURK|nr:glycine zipper 2TM domain-containing protein [Roseateles oligotrophus]MCV2370850.1 glycine zipper 2TM domain-containing protein [Roseateles oligotrophus]